MNMRNRLFSLIFLSLFSLNSYSQEFGTLSGTIRFGGGTYGTGFSFGTPLIVGILQAFHLSDFDCNDWASEQHSVLRFFNVGGDILVPNWSITSTKGNLQLHRPLEDYEVDGFWGDELKQYTSYFGYYLNWRSHFSRWGGYLGIDYEWRNFLVMYPYPNVAYNKIHAIVPAVGVRYRLINPLNEIQGVPFNIVLEGGISYVINTHYDNNEGYGLEALNNGARPMIGVAITTNRFGSIHLRWSKDSFDLFNSGYEATKGFLNNNIIHNDFSCVSIGWALFL